MSEVKGARKFTIRSAEKGDLADLKRMRIALQELLAGRDPRVWRLSEEMTDALDQFYATMMEKDENRVFVAVTPEDKPVGMLMVRIFDNPNMDPRPFGRIDDAWVDPDRRQQGVMRSLTRAAAEFLADRSVPMVMLDWANNNPPSGTCWQNLGFEPLMTMGFADPNDILSRPQVKGQNANIKSQNVPNRNRPHQRRKTRSRTRFLSRKE